MNPGSKNKVAPNNIYTAILAIVLCAVIATAGLVVFKAQSHYGTFYKVVK